jgi:hypothetical protein
MKKRDDQLIKQHSHGRAREMLHVRSLSAPKELICYLSQNDVYVQFSAYASSMQCRLAPQHPHLDSTLCRRTWHLMMKLSWCPRVACILQNSFAMYALTERYADVGNTTTSEHVLCAQCCPYFAQRNSRSPEHAG